MYYIPKRRRNCRMLHLVKSCQPRKAKEKKDPKKFSLPKKQWIHIIDSGIMLWTMCPSVSHKHARYLRENMLTIQPSKNF